MSYKTWLALTAALSLGGLGCGDSVQNDCEAGVDCAGAGGNGGNNSGGGSGGEDSGPSNPLEIEGQVADFSLTDVNDSSLTTGETVSPRDYLQQVSAWYFAHAT